MPPTPGNGKTCYLEIPAADVQRSSEFYRAVFGWNIRQRGDGHLAFDDAVGEVSGSWVTGRPASVGRSGIRGTRSGTRGGGGCGRGGSGISGGPGFLVGGSSITLLAMAQ